MQTKRANLFATVTTEGGILPADLLQRVFKEERDLDGLTADGYHLSGEKIGEAVSRSWSRLTGAWAAFKAGLAKLPPGDLATSLTREKFLLPLFEELKFGRLQPANSAEIDGRTYAISHWWTHLPVHLVGARVDLDKRTPGAAGASRSSPHSMLQELLNRSDDSLWGVVSNGLRLRLLRDNKSLVRQAYVEFDLQAMFDGQVYPDFKLLWLLAHQANFESERADLCRLEKWSQRAIKQGTRVLDKLREGVENAISTLGAGFLRHPANKALREKVKTGQLDKQEYYRQLLRLVYRLLFLFVAEERGLLLLPGDDYTAGRERYTKYYSVARLRHLASRMRGTQHADLYRGLSLVFDKLHVEGSPLLALPALGGFLWSPGAVEDLAGAELHNADMLKAIANLAYTAETSGRRMAVDYRNLGAEELGSVYESLLELHPTEFTEYAFTLGSTAGNERKTTGSFYTPSSLVNCLLDTALDPVLDEAARKPYPERAILDLKICDPACGSGHFLIAAAHRVAKRLAAARTGDEEPAPEAVRTALRDVVGRCLYGVDINPMAAELCKVALWMEALEPGKPLNFLDSHIQVGNALLGMTPKLADEPLPDEAFTPIEGDIKAVCNEFKKRNRDEKRGQGNLFDSPTFFNLADLARNLSRLESEPQETREQVRSVEERYQQHLKTSRSPAQFYADAWCAAFVWPKDNRVGDAITHTRLERIRAKGDHAVEPWMRDTVRALAQQYRFVHWHLAYPQVFGPDGKSGFDCVLGNPPWERVKLQEKEWFAERVPEIAAAPNAAARSRMIERLLKERPELHAAFLADKREAEGVSHFARTSGRYPLCGRGDVNTYPLFAEHNWTITGAGGRAGFIVPSGIATDDTTKHYFRDLIETGDLASLFDFENRKGLFPEVDSRMKFCLVTLRDGRTARGGAARFAFFLHDVAQLADAGRVFTLSADDLALLNPNTRTCPIFRTEHDAELTKAIYRSVAELSLDSTAVLVREAAGAQPERNPWGVRFGTMFHMANDSHLFRNRDQLVQEGGVLRGNMFELPDGERWVPLYEAKMANMWDHRAASVVLSATALVRQGQPERLSEADHADPSRVPIARYWVAASSMNERIHTRWQALLSFSDVTSATNERSFIASIIPLVGAGHTLPLLFPETTTLGMLSLAANLNSFCLDYFGRQKLGGIHYTFFILKQLPVLPPSVFEATCRWDPRQSINQWIARRALELTYTARDLAGFAADCDWRRADGTAKPPYRWDERRRFVLRAQLDAAFFHLYALPRNDTRYILSTFPIVNRRDRQAHGFDRTAAAIIHYYDALAECQLEGKAFEPNAYANHRRDLGWPVAEGEQDGILEGDGDWTSLYLDPPILPIDYDLPEWKPGEPMPEGWPKHVHPPEGVRGHTVGRALSDVPTVESA